MNDMHAPNLTSPTWAGESQTASTARVHSHLPPPCGEVGLLSAYARRRPGGGNGLATILFHPNFARCLDRPPPGSPLRWRARGSPPSPTGGGKFWKSQGRSINLIAIHATCDCPAERGRSSSVARSAKEDGWGSLPH